MILSENSSTLGSRCCSAARSETEWQRNESWKVRRLVPKLNMRPERRPQRRAGRLPAERQQLVGRAARAVVGAAAAGVQRELRDEVRVLPSTCCLLLAAC